MLVTGMDATMASPPPFHLSDQHAQMHRASFPADEACVVAAAFQTQTETQTQTQTQTETETQTQIQTQTQTHMHTDTPPLRCCFSRVKPAAAAQRGKS